MTEVTWGSAIAFDLYLAGMSGGAFLLAVLASTKNDRGWEACGRWSSFLAPVALTGGLALLVLDLGQKERFWHLLVPGHFNPGSPMSIGAWLLTVYSLIAVAFCPFWIPDGVRRCIPLIGSWSGWSNPGIRKKVGRIGMPFAVAVPVYSAVLLSVTAVPLWRNYLLPLVFFFSALAMGFSAGTLLSLVFAGTGSARDFSRPLRFIQKVFQVLLPGLLLSTGAFMAVAAGQANGKSSLDALLEGWMGILWWGGAIGAGIVIPLLFCMTRKPWSTIQAAAVFSMVLVGGLLLRWVVVVAGQL